MTIEEIILRNVIDAKIVYWSIKIMKHLNQMRTQLRDSEIPRASLGPIIIKYILVSEVWSLKFEGNFPSDFSLFKCFDVIEIHFPNVQWKCIYIEFFYYVQKNLDEISKCN